MEYKVNNFGCLDCKISEKCSVDLLQHGLSSVEFAKSVRVQCDALFSPEVYRFFAENNWEIYIARNCSIARKALQDAVELPAFPSFVVGAGGIVFNKQRSHILMIKQTYGPKTEKFPGGYANVGEHPLAAAQREVLEETGLNTTALYSEPLIVHGWNKDATHAIGAHVDLYFVYALAVDGDENVFIDTSEIASWRWVSVHEYLNPLPDAPPRSLIQQKIVPRFQSFIQTLQKS